MTMEAQSTYLSVVETAKLVRQALKREFPGVKFSVRSSKYSGGASIDVSWTDGPTERQVDPVVKDYQGARFDGMIDLKSSADHWLTPDGIATLRSTYGHSYDNETITPDKPEGAVLVHFGADYLFTRRTESEAFRATLEPLVRFNGTGNAGVTNCPQCQQHGSRITETYTVSVPNEYDPDGDRQIKILDTLRCAVTYLARRTDAR